MRIKTYDGTMKYRRGVVRLPKDGGELRLPVVRVRMVNAYTAQEWVELTIIGDDHVPHVVGVSLNEIYKIGLLRERLTKQRAKSLRKEQS